MAFQLQRPSEESNPPHKTGGKNMLIVLAAVVVAVLGLIAVIKFRGKAVDRREHAAPAPKWNADRESAPHDAQPVKLPEIKPDNGELQIDIQIPTSRRPMQAGSVDEAVSGIARLTGTIEPDFVAERPHRPWVR